MNKQSLTEKIKSLINLKYEGSYWDFKQEHHTTDNNHKLLHDIICLANNLENKEAYLIIGVADNGEIIGFSDNCFRRNQQQLNDLVRNKKWEGYGAPDIKVKTIVINDTEVDVIIISKSDYVPFTLAEDIKEKGYSKIYLRKRTIYTRNQDSNTPHNSAASISEVETLIKYRLGILPNPIDRVKRYIGDKNNWKLMNSDASGMSWYYLLNPEFTIEMLDELEDENAKAPNFTYIHMNSRSSMLRINVKYHSTMLYWNYARYVDETRGIVIYPNNAALKVFEIGSDFTNLYDYYYRDSLDIKLSHFLMSQLNLDNEGWLWHKHLAYIPVFNSEEEKQEIESLINQNPERAKKEATKWKKSVSISVRAIEKEENNFIKQDLATNLMIVDKIERLKKK